MSPLTLLGTIAACLLIHLAAHKSSGQPFAVNLKLSRGIMALLMVVTALFVLWRHFDLWPKIFLIEQPGLSLTSQLVSAFCGLLLADLVWLGFGLRFGAKARHDLIVHHVLGLIMCGVAFHFEAGYILILVALVSEILPVTTGIAGLGEALGRPAIKRLSSWLGLLAILVIRLPLWSFFFARILILLRTSQTVESLNWIYPFGLAILIAVTVLEVFWIRAYLRSLSSRRASAGPI